MSPKTRTVGVISGLMIGSMWFTIATARENKTPSLETLKNIGPTLAKSYTAAPIHPDNPDHLWLNEGSGRVLLLMFNKPVSDPKAELLLVGEGIKERFCAESQPDGGKARGRLLAETLVQVTVQRIQLLGDTEPDCPKRQLGPNSNARAKERHVAVPC